MKILIISQVFWPDSVAAAQHLADLIEDLAAGGHTVEIYSSSRSYENPRIRYKSHEIYHTAKVTRFWQTGFGKRFIVGRVLDFATFNFNLLLALLKIKPKEYDVIIGLTVPPLASLLSVIVARHRKIKFIYWTMDLQPELAIATGMLKKGLLSTLLQSIGNFIYRKSDCVLTLDKYMAGYIAGQVGNPSKIKIMTLWPVMSQIYTGNREDNPYRVKNGFTGKIVIMYAGNHAMIHPLDTVLGAASLLRDDERFLFVFIGGGVRVKDVTRFKSEHSLSNIVQLPYEDRSNIHFSLGAADIQLVVQGDGCTGFTHPNKIYGALFIGRPILYVGSSPSHISDIFATCPDNLSVRHGEVGKLVEELKAFAALSESERKKIGDSNLEYAQTHFTRQKLTKELIAIIESVQ